MTEKMTNLEMDLYEFIKKRGELFTKNIPPRMMDAIPNLKNKGLIEIFKRPTSLWSSKERKFVKVKENESL